MYIILAVAVQHDVNFIEAIVIYGFVTQGLKFDKNHILNLHDSHAIYLFRSLSNLAVWLLLLASTFRAILGIFAALISVSTAYDVINQLLSHKALNSPKIEPDQSRDESPCEKTPLLIEEKANITKKEKCE